MTCGCNAKEYPIIWVMKRCAELWVWGSRPLKATFNARLGLADCSSKALFHWHFNDGASRFVADGNRLRVSEGVRVACTMDIQKTREVRMCVLGGRGGV